MPIYSGFTCKKQEFDYNKSLSRLILLLIDQLTLQLQASNCIINQVQFDREFKKLYNSMAELERYKFMPPKFTPLIQPFKIFIADLMGIHNSEPDKEPDKITINFDKEKKKEVIEKSAWALRKNLYIEPTYIRVNRICSTRMNNFAYQYDTETTKSVDRKKTSFYRPQTEYLQHLATPQSLEHQQRKNFTNEIS